MTLPVARRAHSGTGLIACQRDRAVRSLRGVMAELPSGVPAPSLRGSLFRPLMGIAGLPLGASRAEEKAFWHGALAVQMVHEASLLHDDIIDRAPTRRGEASLVARSGVPAALIAGDHLLTASYRCAFQTHCLAFQADFVRAVERTVFGERLQCSRSHTSDALHDVLEIAALKTGELFSLAAGLGKMVVGSNPDAARQMGRRIGRFYQMVDDFLDYCPNTPRGKAAWADYDASRRTWVACAAPIASFDLDHRTVHALLFYPSEGVDVPPMGRVLSRLVREAESLSREAEEIWSGNGLASVLVYEWLQSARVAYTLERQFQGVARRRTPEPAA